MFFRCNNLKLTNKLWDFVKSEVVYKKIDANILIFKVKKELESKVSLDNEILDLARANLRRNNPSAFVSQFDIENSRSKDPYVRSEAHLKLNAQGNAIKQSKASLIQDVYLGRVKLSQSSDILFNGVLDKY